MKAQISYEFTKYLVFVHATITANYYYIGDKRNYDTVINDIFSLTTEEIKNLKVYLKDNISFKLSGHEYNKDNIHNINIILNNVNTVIQL